jgi:hypothetical protein
MSTPVSVTRASGLTLYAFPDLSFGFSIADWTTHRVLLTEGTGANTGIYLGNLDETKATLWRFFEGASQPTWDQSKGYFPLPGSAGDHVLTVTVTDSTTDDEIEGATITLSRTGQRSVGATNASGIAVLGVDAATWTYVVRAGGYASKTGTVVVSANQSLAVELDSITSTPSDMDKACRVTMVANKGIIPTQSRVIIKSIGNSGRQDEHSFHSKAFDGQTDEDGLLVVDLPWSSIQGVGNYRVQMFDIESGSLLHDRIVTVPDQPSANYGDLT